jgi:hypothetical protein
MRLCRRATGHLRASSSTSALTLSDRGSARGKPPVGNAVCRTPGPCCDNLDFDQRLWPYELWDYQEHRGRPDPSKGSSADLCIGRDVLGSVKYRVALDVWSRDLMVHCSRRCGRKRYGPGSPGEPQRTWPISLRPTISPGGSKPSAASPHTNSFARCGNKNHRDSDKTRTVNPGTRHL